MPCGKERDMTITNVSFFYVKCVHRVRLDELERYHPLRLNSRQDHLNVATAVTARFLRENVLQDQGLGQT
jgi:hypothetical protein